MAAQGLIPAVRDAIGAAGVAVALWLASPAAAQTPPLLAPTSQPVASLSGAWEISSGDGGRKCRIQLNQREIERGRMLLGAPPACRMAIPALTGAAQWGLGQDARIRIFKADGGQLMIFRRDGSAGFKAEGDDDLSMAPIGGRMTEAPRSETVAATMQALTGDMPARDAGRAALVGSYDLARSRDGASCVIELQRLPGARPKKGGAVWTAALDASCGDEGLRIFNPVGWQYDDGRIFLVARKGHAIGFTLAGKDEWTKDPVAGRPLWMRKR